MLNIRPKDRAKLFYKKVYQSSQVADCPYLKEFKRTANDCQSTTMLERLLKGLKESNAAKDDEVRTLRQRIDAKNDEVRTMRESNVSLRQGNVALKQRIDAKDDEVQSLKESVRNLRRELNEAQNGSRRSTSVLEGQQPTQSTNSKSTVKDENNGKSRKRKRSRGQLRAKT